jgi:cell division protease FtsH
MEYGMSEKLGTMQFGSSQGQVFLGRDIGHEQNYSDAIAYEIDQEMQSITRECYDRAKKLLNEKSDAMHLLAKTLLEVETLELEQIKTLIEKGIYIENDGIVPSSEGDPESKAEPIIDTLGNVRVRIQKRDDEQPIQKPDLPLDEGNEEPK